MQDHITLEDYEIKDGMGGLLILMRLDGFAATVFNLRLGALLQLDACLPLRISSQSVIRPIGLSNPIEKEVSSIICGFHFFRERMNVIKINWLNPISRYFILIS